MSSQPEVTEALPPEERVGSYVLVRRVGSGGMGEVWLGRHALSGGLGAVKRLSPHARLRARLGAYFEREGRAVARLAHPHIVPVFEAGEGYLVAAFVDGPNLSRRLQTPLEPQAALRIARQVADALAHAHERGVVHRDVKPSNILIDAQDNAYLADFGLAGFVGEDETPGAVAGTPQWMAPEQRRGEPAGPAADQYALGRTLLVMLAGGTVPVEREAALRELPAALPTRLADAIARATAKDPAHRFPSMSAFAEALAAIDLGDLAPPRRLAIEVRDPAPFGWVAGAHRTTAVGPDMVRADFRLRDLAAAGLLVDTGAVERYLAEAGLGDVGFSMWAQSARLGPLSDPSALARASDAVLLLHGWGVNREAWPAVAAAVCRDNAQAIVLAPDLHGFGESRFVRTPTREQASLAGLARMIEGWRRLLGIAAIPTAIVGHSMCGVMLLGVDDDQLGGSVARIALNPVLASHDRTIRKNFRTASLLANTVGRVGFLRRLAVRRKAKLEKDIASLSQEAIDLMVHEMEKMPGGIMAATIRGIATAPTRFGKHRRAAIIVCVDDPWLDMGCLEVAIAELGLGPGQVHRFPTGGHHPHLEQHDNPEWSARNLDQIVRVIDSMLITAGEVSLTSPGDASTLPASHS